MKTRLIVDAITVLILMVTGTTLVLSQDNGTDNKEAHLLQFIPLRVLPILHQVKLFYEYQPAESKYAFGVAPSIRFGQSGYKGEQWAAELQPFMNIIKRAAKTELYASFFLKASYMHNYDLEFETKKYDHPPTILFGIEWLSAGNFSDVNHMPQSFFVFGGGTLLGFRKFFGNHWFMDINAGVQVLAHSKLKFPEQQSEAAGPFIKTNNLYSFAGPACPFTIHLGFGYRFIKK